MSDVLPPARRAQSAAEERLRALFDLYGYQSIETPVLEPTDLFLRKAGEQIAARMYSFAHWNRNLCLRPEHTASVIRAYVNHLQDQPLPVRLQYRGATFRYDKLPGVQHNQFTEVGVECIGGSGPAADAEVLALARHGLDVLGLDNMRFVVGHLGAVLELLGQLGMEPRAQSLVLGELEHLSRAPDEADRVVARLATMLGGEGDDVEAGPDEDAETEPLRELHRSFGSAGAARIAGHLLERANLQLDGGSRPAAEIVERLLLKSRRADPTPALRRAVEFIGRLRDAAGPPADALPAVRGVLAEFGLDDGPVLEVERALDGFAAYFDAPCDVRVDLALARGLRYYTGLVFDVYDDTSVPIAGGGRYDDLVRALGGLDATPAVGFSYVLERVLAAVERRIPTPPMDSAAVLLVPIEEEDDSAVANLATSLRGAGIAVEVDVRHRGLAANLHLAEHVHAPLVLVIGERERAEGLVELHDMRLREELRVPRGELVTAARSRLAATASDVPPLAVGGAPL